MARGTIWTGLASLFAATACVAVVNVAENDLSGVAGGPSGGAASTATSPGTGGSMTIDMSLYVRLSPAELNAIIASACNAWRFEPETSPSKLELLIDVSSSMNGAAPGTTRTKWEVTRDALLEAVPGVNGPGLANNIAVGLMFYPNMVNETVSTTPVSSDTCINTQGEVPMAAMGDNGPATQRTILRSALTQVTLDRGTPTTDAYKYVLYNTVLAPEQLAISGDSHILLITDGMPTLNEGCWNPKGELSNLAGDSVVTAVGEAFSQGVKTFVVGSPGSEEARDWLSKAAFAGGTANAGCNLESAEGPFCHMDMTTAPDFSAALRDGLNSVMNQVSGCKFQIPENSADGTQKINLDNIAPVIGFADGTALLVGKVPTDSATCSDGFRLISNTQMELCGNTCGMMLDDPLATIQLIFGCSAEDIHNTLT